MSLPKYPAYKDSGVEWLGDIPEHWDFKPIKTLSTVNDDVLPESTPFDFELDYVDIGSVSLGAGIEKKETFTFKDAPSRARRLVKDGDVIVSTVRTYLKAIAPISNPSANLIVSTGFAVIRPKTKVFVSKFANYAMQSINFVDEVISRSTGISYPAINSTDLVRIQIPVPDCQEQTLIAQFLDRETAKIDDLIAEQEKLITLLDEKRQAMISHAVTKGLNPNAPMKDSGVEWLGEVPESWDVYPTKRLFKLVIDPAPEDNTEELLSIYTAIGVRPRKSLEAKGNKSTTTDGYWRVKKGDIIVNKLLAWMGAMGVSEYDGVTSPAYDILRQTKPLIPQFYDYLFRCGVMFGEFRRYSRGIMDMRLRLYFEEFGQLDIPYPSIQEQEKIVSFLGNETTQMDTLKAEAQRGIELLKERRSALISAAVTGKIDVRHAMTEQVAT